MNKFYADKYTIFWYSSNPGKNQPQLLMTTNYNGRNNHKNFYLRVEAKPVVTLTSNGGVQNVDTFIVASGLENACGLTVV
ncbi:hypothetical protein BZZ01_29405 [Nostocales cyanobacterium HT-58-2]|nr:hypothetical protein BZZ01_29405 [Nostocales cyanobacterium HT-58-2]